MANAIAYNVTLQITGSGETVVGTVNYSGAGASAMIGNQQLIGTTAETLTFGDVGTPNSLFVKNLDPDNYIEIDSVNTMDKFPQKLLPGEGVLLKPQTGTIYAKANTAACYVWVVAG